MNRKRVQREELLWEKSELVLEYRDEEGRPPMLEPRWAKECWRNQKPQADQKVTAKPLPDWQGSVSDEPFHWKGSQPYEWIFSAISPRKNNVHFISILVSADGTYHLGINLRLIFCLAKIQEIRTQKKEPRDGSGKGTLLEPPARRTGEGAFLFLYCSQLTSHSLQDSKGLAGKGKTSLPVLSVLVL